MIARLLPLAAAWWGLWAVAAGAPASCAQPPQRPATTQPDDDDQISAYVEQLRSPDPRQRVAAVGQLRRMWERAAPAADGLIDLLDDPAVYQQEEWVDPAYPSYLRRIAVAEEARELLTFLARRDKTVYQTLTSALEHRQPAVRRNAAIALGDTENRTAVDALIAVLDDEDPGVRQQAALALFELPEERAAEPLSRLISDPVPEVRIAAIKALGRQWGRVAFDAVKQALADKDDEVRFAAVESLPAYSSMRAESIAVRIELLGDRQERVRLSAADMLRRMDDTLDPLLEAARDESLRYRGHAAYIIAGKYDYGPARQRQAEIRRLFLDVLADRRAEVRRWAAKAPGLTGGAEFVGPLTGLLKDSDRDVRLAAVESLGRLGARSVVPALLPFARHDDPQMRLLAINALGQLKDARAVEALIANLHDDSLQVRRQAIGALVQIKDTRATEPLIELLAYGGRPVRLDAIEALGHLGDARAVPTLIDLLEDRQAGWQLAETVLEALGRLQDPRSVGPVLRLLIEGNPSYAIAASPGQMRELRAAVHEATYRSLMAHGKVAVEPLKEELRRRREKARQSGDRYDQRYVETLEELLRRVAGVEARGTGAEPPESSNDEPGGSVLLPRTSTPATVP